MNQEIKSKIKLISEIMAIYQTTVLSETDVENIKLIKKDITNKKLELEDVIKELNIELNRLYDNGANEIDPEINQLQIIINDVNDLLDDVIPDILTYIQTSEKHNIGTKNEEKIIIPKPVKKIEVETSTQKKEEAEVKIEPIKNEEEIKLVENIEPKEEVPQKIFGKKIEQKVVMEETKEIENVNTIEEVSAENIEIKNTEKDIKSEVISIKISENKDIKKEIKFEDKVEEIQKKPEIKNIVNQNNIFNKIEKETKNINTIKLKQPTEDYRNTASNIVSNRIKNVNSPENAVKKAYNAAEVVMNNIMETLSDSKNNF